jgi:hypothetical protein
MSVMRGSSAVALAAVVVAAVSLSGASHAARRDTLPGLTPARIAQLRDLVLRSATDMGDPHPTDAVVLASTLCDFLQKIDGDDLTGLTGCDFPVFVVAYQGEFVANGVPIPYVPGGGAQPPSGHFAFNVLRAATFEVEIEFGLRHEPVDISGFGPSMPLDLDS